MTADRPHPPGDYPVVIVGTGPGGLQLSYDLHAHGIRHALLSRDEGPGGMFRRFPMFQRLITASRRHCVVDRGSPDYWRWDWNSMVTDVPEHQGLVTDFMDGTNYFPARSEMAAGMEAFAARAGVAARYGCEWRSTRRDDDGRVVLETTDGEYRAPVVAFAVGMLEPWRPPAPGLDEVPHYLDLEDRTLESFAGKRVFVIGKRNSGFEIADALLPWARQLILGSPHPVRPSIVTGFPTPPRARYVLPLEDHMFGGGTFVVDVTIDRVERTADGWRVHTQGTTTPGEQVFAVDEVVACTGFAVEMRDLREKLGVGTFYKDRLPRQSPYWESTTTPGVYFTGVATQGQAGMRKYGWPSHSASVGGFRYNAKVQARHIATTHFGFEPERPVVAPDRVVDYLLDRATWDPAIWAQQSNLARKLSYEGGAVRDDGIVPLIEFVDSTGPDAVAITVEVDREEHTQPAVYVRSGGEVAEHVFEPAWMHDFRTDENRARLGELVAPLRG